HAALFFSRLTDLSALLTRKHSYLHKSLRMLLLEMVPNILLRRQSKGSAWAPACLVPKSANPQSSHSSNVTMRDHFTSLSLIKPCLRAMRVTMGLTAMMLFLLLETTVTDLSPPSVI